MNKINNRLIRLEKDLTEIKAKQVDDDDIFAALSEQIDQLRQVLVSQNTIEKFDESIKNIDDLCSKTDSIYKAFCQKEKKKPAKKASPKKKATFAA